MPYLKPITIIQVDPHYKNGNDLSEKQREILPHILLQKNFSEAARAINVKPTVVYNWFYNDPAFRNAVRQMQKVLDEETRQGLRYAGPKIVLALLENLTDEDPRIRNGAANILRQMRAEDIHMSDIIDLIQEMRDDIDKLKGSKTRRETIDAIPVTSE